MTVKVLSENSKFLVENWVSVREIKSAEARLRRELVTFLESMGADFEKCDWWGDAWIYGKYELDQFYVTRKEWVNPKGGIVMIGIDGFEPDGVFGQSDPPFLYLWTQDQLLAKELKTRIRAAAGSSIYGMAAGGWVVKRNLGKCIPELSDDYFDTVRNDFVEFVTYYIAELERTGPHQSGGAPTEVSGSS